MIFFDSLLFSPRSPRLNLLRVLRVFAVCSCLLSSPSAPPLHIFGYTNLRYDPITGLYFAGWRVYDPTIGQWLTVDPLGLAGGLSNFRDYVGNNATNAKDLSGLQQKLIQYRLRNPETGVLMVYKASSPEELRALLLKNFSYIEDMDEGFVQRILDYKGIKLGPSNAVPAEAPKPLYRMDPKETNPDKILQGILLMRDVENAAKKSRELEQFKFPVPELPSEETLRAYLNKKILETWNEKKGQGTWEENFKFSLGNVVFAGEKYPLEFKGKFSNAVRNDSSGVIKVDGESSLSVFKKDLRIFAWVEAKLFGTLNGQAVIKDNKIDGDYTFVFVGKPKVH